jgi:HD superfamily phosphodiesterase
MSHIEKTRIDILWFKVLDIYTNLERQGYAPRLGIHDIDHISRVLRNAQLILNELAEDQRGQVLSDLVQAAAMLHDLGYSQLTEPETERREHINYSIKLCVDPLRQVGFTKDEITRVQSIILSHHETDHSAKSLEQKILYIADKLDMIGLDGTMRMFMRYASSISNRDQIAQRLLNEMSKRVIEDFLRVGVCRDIIELRWAETVWLLRENLIRSKV